LYTLNFICLETGELLDEERSFIREEGLLFLENVKGVSLTFFNREDKRYYTYFHHSTELRSAKSNKVQKRFDLYFNRRITT
jgi:hypothetical protein